MTAMVAVCDAVSQVVISPDRKVTHITAPLDESGKVDYLEAINNKYSRGVTPETNWEVALLREFGAPKLSPNTMIEYRRRLGINPILPPADRVPLRGYRSGADYSELDNQANESFMNSSGPWTSAQFPHEARWLDLRKNALDRLVVASNRPNNYVPQVASEQDFANLIQQIEAFVGEKKDSQDPGEKMAAAMVELITPQLEGPTAPLSRIHANDSVNYGRDLARMLARRSSLRIGEGDMPGAMSDLLALHRIGCLTGKGNLMQWISGQALEEVALIGDLDLVESGKLTDQQCKQYLQSLQKLPEHRTAADLLDVEVRYQLLDAIQFAAVQHEQTLGKLSQTGLLDELTVSRIKNLDWSEVMRRVNQFLDERVALERNPETRQERIASEDATRPLSQEEQIKMLMDRAKQGQNELEEFIAEMYLNEISPLALRKIETRPKTRRWVVQAGLAAELYRHEHGGYPKSLELLEPYVSGPLIDANTGKSFVLRPTEKGILLYSFGANGTDDSGMDMARLDGWSGDGPTPDDIAIRLEQP